MFKVLIYIFALIFFTFPIFFTCWNIYFALNHYDSLNARRQKSRKIIYLATILVGIVCQAIWSDMFARISQKPWNVPIEHGGDYVYHEWLSSEYGGWFFVLLGLSFVATIVLGFVCHKRKPPLISAILVGMAAVGQILSVLYMIQIAATLESILLLVLPINYILISGRLIADESQCVLRSFKEDEILPSTWINQKIFQLLSMKFGKIWFILLSMTPIIALLIIILELTGQGADALVKAFTMTADWNLSKQIPPPPVEYEGHYLCTVSAGGHRQLVKPIRMGIRAGRPIVVNRQLCIANAFEDLLMDRAPKLHKAMRHFYDKYGYPVSRWITTPLRADITYILMKPLEWCFLIILYLLDTKP